MCHHHRECVAREPASKCRLEMCILSSSLSSNMIKGWRGVWRRCGEEGGMRRGGRVGEGLCVVVGGRTSAAEKGGGGEDAGGLLRLRDGETSESSSRWGGG